MYNLFLETYAAAQIAQWCIDNDLDAAELERISRAAYKNAKNSDRYGDEDGLDDYLLASALTSNDHKDLTINAAFTWAETPEGNDYWRKINNIRLK